LYLLDTHSIGNFKKGQIKVLVTSGNIVKILATKHVNLVNNTTYVLMTKSNAERAQLE